MTSPFLAQWIDSFLRERSIHANSLIITIYGDFIAPHGGTVWLGSFIKLVEPLGLNPRMVRTSVFRLTRENWLSAEQIGRRSYYSLTTTGRRRFEHAYRRIYYEPRQEWEGEWQVVIATSGELTATQREAMRKELLWEGFGAIAPGVLAHPSGDLDSLFDILDGTGAADKVVVMKARSIGSLAARPVRQLVSDCWDLDTLAKNYTLFIERFEPVLDTLRKLKAADAQQCFMVRTLLLHDFRRVLLRDPQLPAELLPQRWPGAAARQLCRELYVVTHRRAAQHAMSVLETPYGRLPDAAPYFYERFGGLGSAPERSMRARSEASG